MPEPKWSRPAAGREPAAAALLSWLTDPDAPRLCVVTGGEGCGKSTLLAWLIGHGTREGVRAERRVHGFVPMAGESALTATWTLAQQLAIAVRTPGDLVTALAADGRRTVIVLPDLHAADDPEMVVELALRLVQLGHVRLIVELRGDSDAAGGLLATRPAVMDLDERQWTDPERHAVWAREQDSRGPADPVHDEAPPELPAVDLYDPAAVCAADPWQVTRLYERSDESYGGLRAAWLRAGVSLTREQTSADRAVVLLAALGDGADPRLPQAIAALAESAAWQVVWSRVRGDVRPPWPGPAHALACGRGHLFVADHQGTVRLVDEGDTGPVGRLPEPVRQVRAIAATHEGDVLVLDAQGRLHSRRSPSAPRATGLSALLDDDPTPLDRLAQAARAQLGSQATALAACEQLLAVGDRAGRVHAFVEVDSQVDAEVKAEPRSFTVRLHEGEVTGVAALRLTVPEDGPGIPLVYSGGYDGTVRAWGPGAEPLASPVRSRPCPVTALAAAGTTGADGPPVLAIGWADGLVEHHALDENGMVRSYWPGAPVHSLALTGTGALLVGTDEMLACLRPV
ncbi:hypothetical protein [Streptomyces camelliae]|uniref:Integrase-type domain-containing protein n=1 Tax=Streptomyces camelliae TaxID=3004093 RepID=A0ABY7P508_9ACTN|nr:hypothetical protein [Streptomyces sp. HUAS 2-6]WBO64624.1 hypothetical protein O1G22_18160 [Streptomyces sp. HUAS 2-6]